MIKVGIFGALRNSNVKASMRGRIARDDAVEMSESMFLPRINGGTRVSMGARFFQPEMKVKINASMCSLLSSVSLEIRLCAAENALLQKMVRGSVKLGYIRRKGLEKAPETEMLSLIKLLINCNERDELDIKQVYVHLPIMW